MAHARMDSARSQGSRIMACSSWAASAPHGFGDAAIARAQARRDKTWAFGRPRAMRRPLLEKLQRHGDGAVELRVDAFHVVVRRVVDFDVGVGAVVFDAPTD